ncbi:MAG: helix-turn-helix domain-containing protein, partial [Faecousia sp.]
RSAINELERAGYVQRHQTTDASGKFSVNEYIIYERPISANPSPEKPSSDNPTPDKPLQDSPSQRPGCHPQIAALLHQTRLHGGSSP